jgi:SPP1 gp7 family putative phage head morphogenesis protein
MAPLLLSLHQALVLQVGKVASSGSKRGRANGKKFERYLSAMAREIQKIVGNVEDLEGADAAVARLSRYERALAKWADDTARKMVTEADKINARNWVNWDKEQRSEYVRGRKERGELISKALRRERLTKPQNEMIQALSKEAAGFIKSVPENVRQRIVDRAEDLRNGGIRQSEFVDEVQRLGGVSESRARLIARTEMSRATTILTQSRAESVGSTHYIWRTAMDGIVRDDHRELEGKVFAWDDPPMHDDGYAYHPGAFPNCRCVPEPLIPEDLGVSVEEQTEGKYTAKGLVLGQEAPPEVLDDSMQVDTDVDFGLAPDEGYSDGISIITSKEPFDIEDDEAIGKVFEKFAKEVAASSVEKALVISPDGNKYGIEGVSGKVGVHLVGKESLTGAKVIHSHPGVNADSFSREDFEKFFKYKLDVMEVAYNGKRHRMRWVGERITADDAYDLYTKAFSAIEDEALKTGKRVESEQHNVMKYMRKYLKGLRFSEL